MTRPEREEFDGAIQKSTLITLRIVSDNCLTSVLSFIRKGKPDHTENIVSRLDDVDEALDALFSKFSRLIKRAIILQACSILKVEPPRLGGSLRWMVEELRSSFW